MADAEDNNMAVDAVFPNDENNEENSDGEEDFDIDENIDTGEYDMLDAKLDDLNVVLDVIEQKTVQIREEFLQLLQSNRKIKEELQQENNAKRIDENNETQQEQDHAK